jgi:hypothetical protein
MTTLRAHRSGAEEKELKMKLASPWGVLKVEAVALALALQVSPVFAQSAAVEEVDETDVAQEDAPADEPSGESSAEEAPEDTDPAEPEVAEEPAQDVAQEQAEAETEPPPPSYEEETVSSVSETGEIRVPEPPSARPRSPFDQGTLRIGIGLGFASSYSEDWMILGLGLGAFVLDGLEAHLDTTFWVIGDPFLATLTPGVRYVLHFVPKVKPYIGGFYRHYFVGNDNLDTDAIGGRVGIDFMTSQMSYFGAGMVYEHFLNTNLFSDQDQFYPEITFAFSF